MATARCLRATTSEETRGSASAGCTRLLKCCGGKSSTWTKRFKADGEYVLDGDRLVVCQSNMEYWQDDIEADGCEKVVNPMGYWTGGSDVDCGATNRKLGSDMGDAMTGGGLHGKDLSKADVSVNVYAHLKAQEPVRRNR